jgi:hypothetical protein
MAEEEKAVVEKEEEDSVEVVIEDPKTEKEEKVEKPESELEVQVETETEEPVKKEVSSEEEIDEYGVKVQARMKKLTAQYRKEERDKLEATRLAQQLLSENEQLKSRMHNLDKGYLTEYGSRPVRVDPKANAWAEKNEWFGNDEAMTYMAFSIHKKLVEEENLDPESEMYYKEVDRRIREEFPQRFAAKKTVGNQVASAGSSASRNSLKQGRRSVKLSASQVAMAKRLNVPLEQYAKYVKD